MAAAEQWSTGSQHTGRRRTISGSVPDPPDPRVFGLPDPDPLVSGMDPDPAMDPDPSVIMQK